jgi:hypothetical protein
MLFASNETVWAALGKNTSFGSNEYVAGLAIFEIIDNGFALLKALLN